VRIAIMPNTGGGGVDMMADNGVIGVSRSPIGRVAVTGPVAIAVSRRVTITGTVAVSRITIAIAIAVSRVTITIAVTRIAVAVPVGSRGDCATDQRSRCEPYCGSAPTPSAPPTPSIGWTCERWNCGSHQRGR